MNLVLNNLHKIFLLVGIAFLLSACSHTGTSGGSTGDSGGEVDPNIEVDAVIEMKDFEFTPNVIEATPGETLTIQVKSTMGLHDFTVDNLDVSSNIVSKGSSDIVQIEIPENAQSEDEYEFHCSMAGHKQFGMTGKIVVR